MHGERVILRHLLPNTLGYLMQKCRNVKIDLVIVAIKHFDMDIAM